MNSYILIGLLSILLANYVQILEEWTKRGLTDTSYKVVLTLLGGPLFAAYGFHQIGIDWLAWLFGGFAVCASAMLLLKLRDLVQTRYRTLN